MDQLPQPPVASQPPPQPQPQPEDKKSGGAKKLLIILVALIVVGLIAFVIARPGSDPQPQSNQTPQDSVETDPDLPSPESEPNQLENGDAAQQQEASAGEPNPETDQPASQESGLTVEQIRQLTNEVLELDEIDPADTAALNEAASRGINSRREILAQIEVQPIDNYTPKTDIGRRYKDLILESDNLNLKDRYRQLVNCQLSMTDLEQFLADLEPLNTQGLELNREIIAALDSGQDNTDLLADLKRLVATSIAADVEIDDILPLDELSTTLISCYSQT